MGGAFALTGGILRHFCPFTKATNTCGKSPLLVPGLLSIVSRPSLHDLLPGRLHLRPRLCQRACIGDDNICLRYLVRLRWLGYNTLASLFLAHITMVHQALHLLLGGAGYYPDSIAVLLPARLQQLYRIYHRNLGCSILRGLVQPGNNLLVNRRMHNLLKQPQRGRIVEDTCAQLAAVYGTIRGSEDIAAKRGDNLLVDGRTGLLQAVRDMVSVQRGRAEFCKHFQDGAFATGNIARKPNKIEIIWLHIRAW